MRISRTAVKALMIAAGLAVAGGFADEAWAESGEASGLVAITEENFPADEFREAVRIYDLDEDGYFSDTELGAVKTLSFEGIDVGTLEGLQYFKKLTWFTLTDCEAGNIKLNALRELDTFTCTGSTLGTVEISDNLWMRELTFNNNTAEQLTIDGCGMREFSLDDNTLGTLQISNNLRIETLSFSGVKADLVSVSEQYSLDCFEIDGNTIDKLSLANVSELKELTATNSHLTDIEVSDCEKLSNLILSGNDFTQIDLTGCTGLWCLDISENKLTEFDLSKYAKLSILDCSKNNISKFTGLKGNTEIFSFDCSDNALTELDVTGCTDLYDLDCSNNHISSLQMQNNKRLTELDISNTDITMIDPTGTALSTIVNSGAAGKKYVCDENGTIDISDWANFDLSRVISWKNAEIDGTVLTPKSGYVSYVYDLGNGCTCEFAVECSNVKREPVSFNTVKISAEWGTEDISVPLRGTADTDVVTYTSSDTSVATVDSNGKLMLLKPGTTTITAEVAADEVYAGCASSYTCAVIKIIPKTTFEKNQVCISYGDTFTNKLNVPASDMVVTYSSEDESVVTVDENGTITPVKSGEARVTAHVEGNDYYYPTAKTYDVNISKAYREWTYTGSLEMTLGDRILPEYSCDSDIDGKIHFSTSPIDGMMSNDYVLIDDEGYFVANQCGYGKVDVEIDADECYSRYRRSISIYVKSSAKFTYPEITTTLGHASEVVNPLYSATRITEEMYFSRDESIAEVDFNSGEITAHKAGEVIIEAYVGEEGGKGETIISYKLIIEDDGTVVGEETESEVANAGGITETESGATGVSSTSGNSSGSAVVPENTAAETVVTDVKVPEGGAAVGTVAAFGNSQYRVMSDGSVSLVRSSKKVTSVSIPASMAIGGKSYPVTTIADNAFKNCKKLKKVTIGANIKTIGKNAFYGCAKLKTVTFKGKAVGKIGKNAFKKIAKRATFRLPRGKAIKKKYTKMIKKAKPSSGAKYK